MTDVDERSRDDMRLDVLVERSWENPDLPTPERIWQVEGMLNQLEKRMLYVFARDYYQGRGALLDMGAFLGGSTICFATGLRDQGVTEPILHSYDRFYPGPWELENWFKGVEPPGNTTLPIFQRNLEGYEDLLVIHEGDANEETWDGAPIEILFVDIAKSPKTWDHITETFFPALLPDGLLILQDYLFERTGPWHHIVMETLTDRFAYVCDTARNSMVWRCLSTPERVVPYDSLDTAERHRLMRQAISRMDTEAKRQTLREAATLID